MSPNFALYISQDVLRLLIRVDGGWAEIGHVSATGPDMAERLSDLREEARRRSPLGMATKIIIPNDYIRYLTLPPDQGSPDQVYAALDGATPYAVADLVVDHQTDASGTQVAAVTRTMLEEAENFAVDHGLSPVSFVANPREGTFDREVFFGKSRGADKLLPGGVELGPDDEPMTLVPLPPYSEPVTPAPPPVSKPVKLPEFPTAEAEPDPEPTPVTFASRRPAKPTAPTKSAEDVVEKISQLTEASDPAPDTAAPPKPVFASRAKPAPRVQGAAPALPKFNPSPTTFSHRSAVAASRDTGPHAMTADRPAPTRDPGRNRTLVPILGGALVAGIAGLGWWLWPSPDPEVITPPPAAPVETVAAPSAPAPVEIPRTAPPQVTAAVILSDDDARRIYAATGVWQKSPPLPQRPRAEQLDLRRPAASPAVERAALPVLGRDPETLRSDARMGPPQEPPPPGLRFVLDANGLVPITPEGALTPGGVIAYAAAPPVSPPTRPGTSAPVAVEQATAPGTTRGQRPAVLPPTRPSPEAQPPVQAALTERPALTPRSRPFGPSAPATPPATGTPGTDPAPAPNGILIYRGAPSIVPPTRQDAAATPPIQQGSIEDTLRALETPTDLRPPTRVAAAPGGVALSALAPSQSMLRPSARPNDIGPTDDELADAAPEEPASPYAVARSLRPSTRPGNIGTLARKAKAKAAAQPTQTASAAVAAGPAVARPLRPSGTTARSVATRATETNVLRLNRINLIGVFGTQRNRRALVRLANGRFMRVGVGDRLDGGRVSSIGADALQYTKGGRRVTLNMPRG